tara:strand:+ start:4379 stop:6580 length:2202 start_codon:yes stop_codon:yes gene_type:complete
MPQLIKQNILVPLDGLSQEHETDGSVLGEDTINFFPDGDGYLVNYPGRAEYFREPTAEEREVKYPSEIDLPEFSGTVGSAQNSYTVPPTGRFTKVKIFRDPFGQSHIVFVVDNKLCVVEGNGYKVIYTFSGVQRESASEPRLFNHNNFLVIANLGDPVLIWDGRQDVVPLGVTEIPDPPTVSIDKAPWYTLFGDTSTALSLSARVGQVVDGLVGGIRSSYGYWGNLGIWYSGPVDYEPGGTHHGLHIENRYEDPRNWNETYWRWKIRYFDRYGNLGPVSGSTPTLRIPKNLAIMSTPNSPEMSKSQAISLADFDGKSWSTVYWRPPKHDWHIAGAILYKTLDLHKDKANSKDVYYQEYTQNNTNCCRHTSIAGDTALTASSLLDSDADGPPSTDMAASWGSRIVIRDPLSKEKLLYSDQGQMGQFRASNVYKAKDSIEALLPLGDRLLIITSSTSEILYYNRNGDIQHLETFENKGSLYGNSFAVFGDQAFGLFNDGFFIFNGQSFKKVKSPYFLKGNYIDQWLSGVQDSVVQGEWYFLSVRKELTSSENNIILMCHLPTGRWFQVSESVRDMDVSGDYIIGVDDSIYFLYRGNTYSSSTIHMRGVLNSKNGIMQESTLSNLSLFLDPSSKNDVSVEVTGSNEFDAKTGSAVSYPARSTVTKDVDYYPYFNDDKTTWEDGVKWVSPNDFHIDVDLDNNVTAFKHDIKFTFAGPQRVKAIGIEHSIGRDIADKK